MGLDAVELVMEVEEHFGVTIADDEAAAIATVGDLNQLVLSRLQARDSGGLHYLPAFLELRAAVREVVGDPTLRVRRSTQIAEVVPPRRRPSLWRKLQQLIGKRPPSLGRPPWLVWLMALVGFIACCWGCTNLTDNSSTQVAQSKTHAC